MSNIVEFASPQDVEREAHEWVVRMDDEEPLTAEELTKLRQWYDKSPTHRRELRRVARLWQQADLLSALEVPIWRVRARWSGARKLWIAAAASVAIVAIALVTITLYSPGINGTYITAIGQQRQLDLPDGSFIEINTDSRVRVHYTEARREIELMQGEAHFQVARDRNRPFEVYAANGVIRAIGTAFSVRIAQAKEVPEEVRVTVTHGSVEILEETAPGVAGRSKQTPHSIPTRLRAGEMATVQSRTRHVAIRQLPEPELDRRLAWHDGYLEFDGEPLADVVREVNRYSQTRLQVTDPQIASLTIGARFKIGDLQGILNVLHDSFGISTVQIDARTIQLEPPAHPPAPR